MYVLLPIVLGIWGFIGWKIYAGLQGNEAEHIAALPHTPGTGNEHVPDTFQLAANYRDPFLGKSNIPSAHVAGGSGNSKPSQLPKQANLPVAKNWPEVIYGGMIRKKEGLPFALLNVGGQDHLVKAGEQAGEVQVLVIYRDSIQVSRGKEKRFFRK